MQGTSASSFSSSLSIDEDESCETRIRRLITEHPVIVFSRSSCSSMCHVIKTLLATIGVHPAVIHLDDLREIAAVPSSSFARDTSAPAVFIGGACFGGFESLVALHLTGRLVPKLIQVGALPGDAGRTRAVLKEGDEDWWSCRCATQDGCLCTIGGVLL